MSFATFYFQRSWFYRPKSILLINLFSIIAVLYLWVLPVEWFVDDFLLNYLHIPEKYIDDWAINASYARIFFPSLIVMCMMYEYKVFMILYKSYLCFTTGAEISGKIAALITYPKKFLYRLRPNIVYTFITIDGEIITSRAINNFNPNLRIGDTITVYYLPHKPFQSAIQASGR